MNKLLGLILVCLLLLGCRTGPNTTSQEDSNTQSAPKGCPSYTDISTWDECNEFSPEPFVWGKHVFNCREDCYTDFVLFNADDLSDCESIYHQDEKEESNYRDLCFKTVAKRMEDISLCDSIVSHYWKSECYSELGIILNDTSVCSVIEDQDEKDICFWKVGINLRDIRICDDFVKEFWRKEDCYINVAKITGNESICEMLNFTGYEVGKPNKKFEECMGYIEASKIKNT